MYKDKPKIPRKLKKAVKKLIRETTIPRVRMNVAGNKLIVINYEGYKLKYGNHDKWTQLAIYKINNEIRESYKRMLNRHFEMVE